MSLMSQRRPFLIKLTQCSDTHRAWSRAGVQQGACVLFPSHFQFMLIVIVSCKLLSQKIQQLKQKWRYVVDTLYLLLVVHSSNSFIISFSCYSDKSSVLWSVLFCFPFHPSLARKHKNSKITHVSGEWYFKFSFRNYHWFVLELTTPDTFTWPLSSSKHIDLYFQYHFFFTSMIK